MLKRLTLQHIAIIRQAEITFNAGLTVITGETGSGKSLLMDAVALAFGARISAKDIIQHGKDRALVEVLMDIPVGLLVDEGPLVAILAGAGIEIEGDVQSGQKEVELLISRELTLKASRCRINGVPVSREVIESIRPYLLDVHGQHELTNLFQADRQRDYLDQLGDSKFQALKKDVAQTYQQWQQVQRQIDQVQANQQHWLQQRDFLQFQCQELEGAELADPEEDTQLQQQRERLSSLDQIKRQTAQAAYLLSMDSQALDGLQQAQKCLGGLGGFDPVLDAMMETLTGVFEETRQLSASLSRYNDQLDEDSSALDGIIERLDILERMKRKYGPRLDDVLLTYQRLQAELETVTQTEADMETLQAAAEHLLSQLQLQAKALSQNRHEIAKRLEKSLQKELTQLALPSVSFQAAIEKVSVNSYGQDQVKFLFSANPGEPLRPLAKVASGGELSRVLLALKMLTAFSDGISTLVFDEIDTGISGTTAKAVAEKLFQLGKEVQVIVITHQPMIAAVGEHHWHVEKRLHAKTVSVEVTPVLTESERLSVISRLIHGSDTAIELVAQLREQRHAWV